MSELLISTPVLYKNKPGALNELGEVVEQFAKDKKKVLLIFSKTAKEKTGEIIHSQLASKDISFAEEIFLGFPSKRQAEEYAETARKENVDLLIAVGGGRTMDVTKAAGTFSDLPVITVPTIAATCAAWAAVSILYTDDGDYDRGFMNPKSPVAIVADTAVIANAPVRYIKAGLADTIAKWYEPEFKNAFPDIISQHGSKLALDTIRELSLPVIANAEKGIVDENTIKVVDSIIYLAGFVGSFFSTIALSFGFYALFKDHLPYISPLFRVLLGVAISISANIGDLIESVFKRSAGIKDSGNIFPGRGGALDSIDSEIASAPLFFLIFKLIMEAV